MAAAVAALFRRMLALIGALGELISTG